MQLFWWEMKLNGFLHKKVLTDIHSSCTIVFVEKVYCSTCWEIFISFFTQIENAPSFCGVLETQTEVGENKDLFVTIKM